MSELHKVGLSWDDLEILFRVKSRALGLYSFAKPTPLHDAFVQLLIRVGAELSSQDPNPNHPASRELQYLMQYLMSSLTREADRIGGLLHR
jgi:hypothetical protein